MAEQPIKEFPDGSVIYDFDPSDEYQDSEGVGEELLVKQRLKGLTRDTAERKKETRAERVALRAGYHEFVPCVKCCDCVIIRGMESDGVIRNQFYACRKLKIQVSRYGTCTQATEGNGPLVLEKKIRLEEIEKHKNQLIN